MIVVAIYQLFLVLSGRNQYGGILVRTGEILFPGISSIRPNSSHILREVELFVHSSFQSPMMIGMCVFL